MEKLLNSLKTKSRQILSWTWENILFLETIFLLAFIPLFPKIPVLDIKNTWVYIRAEDFVVFFVILTWLSLLFKKKISPRTPLTMPILIFWIIGGVATLHGILVIFPKIANVFTNVAFLSYIRHIEYMSLFFIAYHGLRDKKKLPIIIATLTISLLAVIGYGFGQKYFGLPAYLTMNEEFAKGIPITLSQLSRVPSTFAGHYDLAAYLVLIIPIIVSLFFGIRNWIIKLFLLGTSLLGLVLLFMTVSRVSFIVLFISLFIVIFIQKRKLAIALIPIAMLMFIVLLSFQSSLFDRFKSTVSEVDVIVDSHSGESLGHVRFVDKEYFSDKVVLQHRVRDIGELEQAIKNANQNQSSNSAIFPYRFIPREAAVVNAVNISTGENLPQGTGYINLYLAPVIRRVPNFFYELPIDSTASVSAHALVLQGNFLVKRASAYDLSFTTRFQGEWPKAIEAFKNNIFIGSGYGSVSLAVDNNYLRILGETGLLGFLSFLTIILIIGIYIKKIYSTIDSKLVKSFILGSSAGFIGLSLNAILIDVFEASKIAFLLWILAGVNLRLLTLYQSHDFSILTEIKKIAISPFAVFVYLILLTGAIYSQMLGNYFVGDDFTWLRWVADCTGNCSLQGVITSYFTDAGGFFYRPGTKLYFFIMHNFFWLNQVMYHIVSLLLHFVVALLFFLLSRKVFKNNFLSVSAALLFLILSGYSEAVFWISSTGYLISAALGLSGLLLFIAWEEKRKVSYLLGTFILFLSALFFQELSVVYPMLILAYKLKDGKDEAVKILKRWDYLILFSPFIIYLAMRFFAKSHWLSGDYSYDFLKLPFNVIGNLLGYSLVSSLGTMALPLYTSLRDSLRQNLLLATILVPIVLGASYIAYRLSKKYLTPSERKVVIFGLFFFIFSLIPYLGLGNIASRYSYLATMGIVFIIVIVFKKIYELLNIYGKDISVSVTSIVILIFILFHIIQNQQAYFDWRGAGDRSVKFFVSLENKYTNVWRDEGLELHFVDVPTRVGQAWIFPVGLEDAIWFAFKNPNVKIFKHSNVEEAVLQAGYKQTNVVLKFLEDGSVKEIDRTTTPPDLIMPPN